MRLVDADALKAKAFGKRGGLIHTSDIDALPTVDAVPVRRGYWIRHDYADIVDGHYVPNYECSVCHAWKRDDSDYCPDCGALNDGKDGDNHG